VILLTHKVREHDMDQAIARIEALPTIGGSVKRIRMETLG
jgi:homoserine dehydrogenase